VSVSPEVEIMLSYKRGPLLTFRMRNSWSKGGELRVPSVERTASSVMCRPLKMMRWASVVKLGSCLWISPLSTPT
jgi:hypothetical protein